MFPPIPFSPIRTSLYSPQELMGTLDQGDYKSFEHTVDFRDPMTSLAANDTIDETRSVPATRRRDRAGTLIRHAGSGTTAPIGTLETSLGSC
jgi:hypothetical protein